MRYAASLFLFLWACTLQAGPALEAIISRGVLRVGTEANYYPFELINKQGEMVGFDMDMAKVMAKSMGVKLEIVPTTVDSIVPGLLGNKFDIAMRGWTLTQERNLKVSFANPYYMSGMTIILAPKHQNVVKDYRDLNQKKYTVVSKIGTTGEWTVKRLIPQAKYVSFETEQDAVLEVLGGRADAFVFDAPFNAITMLRYGKEKLVHLSEPFTFEPLAWAIRQGDPDFLNWLNHFLFQVQKDGTYDKLHRKWFMDHTWLKDLQES